MLYALKIFFLDGKIENQVGERMFQAGLLQGTRRDVRRPATKQTADEVGARRGTPVVLIVETFPLVRDVYQFRCSGNRVWLILNVPSEYLWFPDK